MVEWRWRPWTYNLSLLPTGDRLSRSGFSAAVLNRLCSPIVEIREQRSEDLEPCTSALARALVKPIVPLSVLLARCLLTSFVLPQHPRSMAQGGRNVCQHCGQERAQQADTVSRAQHRDGLHSESPSMLVSFYQLDTSLHVHTKKECQLKSRPQKTGL